jgi:hypothetical protein
MAQNAKVYPPDFRLTFTSYFLLTYPTTPMQSSIPETVYTITDWYDGARAGIADFGGSPHYYECQWDNNPDSDNNTYLLTPVNDYVFQLALEDWEIWRRYEAASRAGNAPPETHPALPEDRPRHDEIQILINGSLSIVPSKATKVTGEFEYGKNLVRWTVIV